ncbi:MULTISPECIES: aminotransferase class III-fold pyridoxal phosphate-dependent enzyme [unclassified Streptomyces]|uniref:aminotransferase class III-fold pyridoxal phosphate-dependent enzyme n=1 Tax=unclassified Streptomyces TaxID=2593676 RepID=UPI002E7814D7|nr:aminotransferase class III-fold pyridoxal phosphate-dependent enzyme [Streptomyces sp. SP18ES09]MEE1819432.1 aminotransferase class III-fold pyridoxal phosphate-dependent enzyme [Streptomyces sp. SP18ES09]
MLPTVSKADGVYLYDTEGTAYLDGCSGAINVNLGHTVPEVTERMHRQIDEVCFTYRTQFRSPALEELTTHLARLAPGDLNQVQFCNSGSEGIETALRLATLYHATAYRPFQCVVLTEEPSYHGMTAGALAASGHPLRRTNLTPLLTNQTSVARVRPSQGALRADAQDWEEAIKEIGPHRIGAVVIEPVGGASSGAVPTDPRTLVRLRELADEHGFLLIADEVMTGLGRTGRWFGCDHAGIAPDVMVLGKGLSAGFMPVAAVLVSDRIAGAFDAPLGSVLFGHTMAGAPLAAATSAAVLDYLEREDIPARAARTGARLQERLAELAGRHRLLTDVRGAGLQLALGVQSDPDRFPGTSLDLVESARAEGLLLYPAGVTPVTESVMVAPPLTIADGEVDDLLARLERAVERTEQAPPGPSAPQLLALSH